MVGDTQVMWFILVSLRTVRAMKKFITILTLVLFANQASAQYESAKFHGVPAQSVLIHGEILSSFVMDDANRNLVVYHVKITPDLIRKINFDVTTVARQLLLPGLAGLYICIVGGFASDGSAGNDRIIHSCSINDGRVITK